MHRRAGNPSFSTTEFNATENTLTPVWINNQFLFNARIGYTITPHVSVALSAQQLNTLRLVQSAAPPVERRVILTLVGTL